jgi:o-succinylbenzoate synthase
MDFRLELRRYSLPFRHAVRTAHGPWNTREGLFVRAVGSGGSVGYGEASPIPRFGSETVDADEAFCRSLGDRIDDQVLSRVPGNLGALRNALACAIGAEAWESAHRSLAVAALLPAGRGVLEAALPLVDAGFRVFKWKVGVGAAEDERAILDDLIGALPGGSKIRLDANGGWNRRTAEQWMDHAVGRPVEFIEQPVAPDSRGAEDNLLGLAADYPVALALDESIAGDGDVDRWLDMGWKGYFVIKPSLLGDVRAVLGKLHRAAARVVFSSSLETGIGARESLGAAFSWKGDPAALGFGVWPLFSDSRFDGPSAVPLLRIEDVERIDPESLWNAAT